MKKILLGLTLALLASGAAHAADLGGKLLKVGSDTTSPPMESVDPASGQIVGFDVDVVNAVCAKINCKVDSSPPAGTASSPRSTRAISTWSLPAFRSPTNARRRWISPIPTSSTARRSSCASRTRA
jgi:ABC-type amino acid transport substrate-binding protein